MADPLRDDIASSKFPLDTSGPTDQSVAALLPSDKPALLPGVPAGRNLPLPVAENRSLNRAAENIGTAIGTTVGTVRFGLTLVHDRNRNLAQDVSNSFSRKAESLSAAAAERAQSFSNAAEQKVSQIKAAAQEQFDDLRMQAQDRVRAIRKQAEDAKQEHPIELLLAFAATAFVVGFSLRVWRSMND